MATKEILLKIEWKDMDSVVLTNSKGDTYTSKSEELHDFLHSEPSPEWYKKQIDIAKKNFTKDFNGSLEQYAVDNFIAGANWQSTPATPVPDKVDEPSPEQDELAKAKQEIERLKEEIHKLKFPGDYPKMW